MIILVINLISAAKLHWRQNSVKCFHGLKRLTALVEFYDFVLQMKHFFPIERRVLFKRCNEI